MKLHCTEEDQLQMARYWTRAAQERASEAQGASGTAMEIRCRTKAVAERSRQLLHRSDPLLAWWETYGPRPASRADPESAEG
jgi:hypothetical protein